MTFYADKHELFDGDVLLYRRQSSSGEVHPVWQMRLRVAGRIGYVTKSCKTKNYDDARSLAKRQLFTLQHKVENGIPIKDWTFKDQWRDWYDRQVSRGTWREARKKWHLNYFNRYFAPYFGEKVLSAITAECGPGPFVTLDGRSAKQHRNPSTMRQHKFTNFPPTIDYIPNEVRAMYENVAQNTFRDSPILMQLSDDLEREMMNERGPNEFPAGVLKNGDRVEVVLGELMGADFPIYHMVIRRGNKAIRKALKTVFDDVEKRFDDINKCFDDMKKDENGEIDVVDVGLAIGRWEALNWVLGEEWDRSLVDVVSVSSSRDQEAIRQAYMECWDKSGTTAADIGFGRRKSGRAAKKTWGIMAA